MAKKKKVKKKIAKKTPKPGVVSYPDANKQVSEFEQKLDNQIADNADENVSSRRGRGRPRKEPEAAPAEFDVPEKIISQAIRVPFDLWSISADVKKLKLQDDEADLLAAPVKQLLDYYAPKIPTIAIAWASLALASYSILAGRLKLIQELKKQKTSKVVSSPSGAGPASQARSPGPALSDKFPDEEEVEVKPASE